MVNKQLEAILKVGSGEPFGDDDLRVATDYVRISPEMRANLESDVVLGSDFYGKEIMGWGNYVLTTIKGHGKYGVCHNNAVSLEYRIAGEKFSYEEYEGIKNRFDDMLF